MWIETFLKLDVFPTKWKTTCCFVESTDCFALRGFAKGWKLFDLVDLTVKPNQSVVSCFQPIVSLKILTKFSLDWWICLKWFLTEYTPSLNVLTNLWKVYIVCYMFLKGKRQFWEIQFDKFDLKFFKIHIKLWIFKWEWNRIAIVFFSVVLWSGVILFSIFCISIVVLPRSVVCSWGVQDQYSWCGLPKVVCFLRGLRSLLWCVVFVIWFDCLVNYPVVSENWM